MTVMAQMSSGPGLLVALAAVAVSMAGPVAAVVVRRQQRTRLRSPRRRRGAR